MKKRFGLYAAAWAVLFALFNVIAFVSVGWAGCEKYTDSFWIGYAFIAAAFVGQLICAGVALKQTNAQKLFYRISLIKTSYSGLITTFIVGGLCMVISPLPYWVGVIACSIVLAVNVISVIKAAAVVGEVERIDQKVKQQTFFIKSMTVDAESLMARAQSEAAKEACKRVYEAVRYSDPMSNEMLGSVEGQITLKFAEFSDAVAAGDDAAIDATAQEVLILIKDRNSKCKLLK